MMNKACAFEGEPPAVGGAPAELMTPATLNSILPPEFTISGAADQELECDPLAPSIAAQLAQEDEGTSPSGGSPEDRELSLASGTSRPALSHLLVVEDSMIIVIDAEESLLRLGVPRVTTASNVASALKAIHRERPDAALLDFNLGYETSEPIAAELDRLDVPYWFVTGYGDAVAELSSSQARGVLQKPYSADDLARVVKTLRGDT